MTKILENLKEDSVRSFVEEVSPLIEHFIIRGSDDPSQEVRNTVRQAILLYRKVSPMRCADLINFGLQSVILTKEVVE